MGFVPDSRHIVTQFRHNMPLPFLVALISAKVTRIGSPLAVARGNQIGDDATDILLLRRIVVGSGMVSGYRHRPCLVPIMKVAEEFCRVLYVAVWVEHILGGAEIFTVIIVVDLHAADVDELRAAAAGDVELPHRILFRGRKDRLAFDVHGIGIERALAAGLRQTD